MQGFLQGMGCGKYRTAEIQAITGEAGNTGRARGRTECRELKGSQERQDAARDAPVEGNVWSIG